MPNIPRNQLGQPTGSPYTSLLGSGFAGRGPNAAAGGPASFVPAKPVAPVSPVSKAPQPAAPAAPKVVAADVTAPNTVQPSTGIDFSSDPILAQIQVMGQQTVPNAIAEADAARKQLLTAFGDPSLARSTVFGGKGFSVPGVAGGADITIPDTSHTGDEGTAVAAQQNPYSTLARLLYAHNQNDTSIDETRNSQNLFYSGTRANDLSGEQHQYGQNQSDAYTAVASALAQIEQQVQMAYQNYAAQMMGAEQDSYLRSLARAASSTPPAAAPSSGGSGFRTIEDAPGAITKTPTGATVPVNIPASPAAKKTNKPTSMSLLFK